MADRVTLKLRSITRLDQWQTANHLTFHKQPQAQFKLSFWHYTSVEGMQGARHSPKTWEQGRILDLQKHAGSWVYNRSCQMLPQRQDIIQELPSLSRPPHLNSCPFPKVELLFPPPSPPPPSPSPSAHYSHTPPPTSPTTPSPLACPLWSQCQVLEFRCYAISPILLLPDLPHHLHLLLHRARSWCHRHQAQASAVLVRFSVWR